MRSTIQKVAKHTIQNLLRSEEYSTEFLARKDTKEIDNEIEKMSIELTDKFVAVLKSRGYLKPDVQANEKEFQELFDSTLKEYLEKLGTNENHSK